VLIEMLVNRPFPGAGAASPSSRWRFTHPP
jgi:hypothetical protein